MKKSHLIKYIFQQMKAPLAELGFKLDIKNKQFTKQTDEAKLKFQLCFYNRVGGYIVEPFAWIHMYNVENIYHQITIRDKQYHSYTITLGNSIGTLLEKENEDGILRKTGFLEFYIGENEEAAIIQTITDLISIFKNYALDYLVLNSKINRVDQLLNNDPYNPSVHSSLNPGRCISGLISAKLVSRPNYYELVDIYSNEMQVVVDEEWITEFKRVKVLLESL